MQTTDVTINNRLIFDFMGCIHSEDVTIDLWEMSGLKYKQSWNQLMPVIEKISRVKYDEWEDEVDGEILVESDTAYPRTFGMINSKTGNPMFRFNRCILFEAPTLIEAAWLAVVDFIKSHNESSKHFKPNHNGANN